MLDTKNSLVKMQIFELLSGVCLYSEEGYSLALEALAHYKVRMKGADPWRVAMFSAKVILAVWSVFYFWMQRTKGQPYRFSLLLQELKGAETEEYVACILAFINCIIAGAPDISSRVRLRNEIVGKWVRQLVIKSLMTIHPPTLHYMLIAFMIESRACIHS